MGEKYYKPSDVSDYLASKLEETGDSKWADVKLSWDRSVFYRKLWLLEDLAGFVSLAVLLGFVTTWVLRTVGVL